MPLPVAARRLCWAWALLLAALAGAWSGTGSLMAAAIDGRTGALRFAPSVLAVAATCLATALLVVTEGAGALLQSAGVTVHYGPLPLLVAPLAWAAGCAAVLARRPGWEPGLVATGGTLALALLLPPRSRLRTAC